MREPTWTLGFSDRLGCEVSEPQGSAFHVLLLSPCPRLIYPDHAHESSALLLGFT